MKHKWSGYEYRGDKDSNGIINVIDTKKQSNNVELILSREELYVLAGVLKDICDIQQELSEDLYFAVGGMGAEGEKIYDYEDLAGFDEFTSEAYFQTITETTGVDCVGNETYKLMVDELVRVLESTEK